MPLYRLNAFGGRPESDMASGHVFPLAVRIAVSLAAGGPDGGGARAGVRCGMGLPLPQLGDYHCSTGVRYDPGLLEPKG